LVLVTEFLEVAANKRIKPTAITRAGYEYQGLVGIEMLIWTCRALVPPHVLV